MCVWYIYILSYNIESHVRILDDFPSFADIVKFWTQIVFSNAELYISIIADWADIIY